MQPRQFPKLMETLGVSISHGFQNRDTTVVIEVGGTGSGRELGDG